MLDGSAGMLAFERCTLMLRVGSLSFLHFNLAVVVVAAVVVVVMVVVWWW